jgi:hypothetical protein
MAHAQLTRTTLLAAAACLSLAVVWSASEAPAATIGLTPAALGLLGDDAVLGTKINHASTLIADQPGLKEGAIGVKANILEVKLVGLTGLALFRRQRG